MTLPAIQIDPRHWQIVAALVRRHVPQCDVWAFGSRAAGHAKPYSDLDLAIAGPEPVAFSTLAALADELEESALSFKVDLVDWSAASPSFQAAIHAGRVPVQPGEAARRAYRKVGFGGAHRFFMMRLEELPGHLELGAGAKRSVRKP